MRLSKHPVFLPLALCFGLAFFGCSEENALSVSQADLAYVDFRPGYQKLEARYSDGKTMPYVLHSPVVTSLSKLPLVIVLHGTEPQGTYKGETILKFLAVPALQNLNAVFIAPTLMAPHWTYPDALEMIETFVQGALEADWPIDPNKIVVIGYSNGGMGVWTMTGINPDLFAAGIAMAAEPVIGSLKGTSLVPKYVIHSKADEVFPFDEVERDVLAEIEKGAPITFASAEYFSHSGISNYVPMLRESIPWLQAIFK
ncbi:prolyl oligopeptidase family serine peptidase [bacterium]|nr:prolyl oligopeptidase family serine peptidase [bacterium]